MSYYQLDEKDIELLSLLLNDSRTTLSSLGEKINTSIPTVRSRIDKLHGLGIIEKFTLILNYDLLSSHPLYYIVIRCSPSSLNEIIKDLNTKKEFLEIHELIAESQIMIKTIPMEMSTLQGILQYLRQFDGIHDIKTMPIAQTHKKEYSILPSQISVRLRCEYCAKPIERDYQSMTIDGVTHFFCCTSCTTLYSEKGLEIKG
ncbi:MAG: AsnC family transcriptional regulator [Candidatus Hodarchaeales archaeon]|jgi:DNA-binding Lrp family transcriptional regulator